MNVMGMSWSPFRPQPQIGVEFLAVDSPVGSEPHHRLPHHALSLIWTSETTHQNPTSGSPLSHSALFRGPCSGFEAGGQVSSSTRPIPRHRDR